MLRSLVGSEMCIRDRFIVSASGGRKSQFWANFDSWGLLYRPAFTDKGQIWCAKADRTSTLTCRISSECVHCVAFRWPITTILGKFEFWGLPRGSTDSTIGVGKYFTRQCIANT